MLALFFPKNEKDLNRLKYFCCVLALGEHTAFKCEILKRVRSIKLFLYRYCNNILSTYFIRYITYIKIMIEIYSWYKILSFFKTYYNYNFYIIIYNYQKNVGVTKIVL